MVADNITRKSTLAIDDDYDDDDVDDDIVNDDDDADKNNGDLSIMLLSNQTNTHDNNDAIILRAVLCKHALSEMDWKTRPNERKKYLSIQTVYPHTNYHIGVSLWITHDVI